MVNSDKYIKIKEIEATKRLLDLIIKTSWYFLKYRMMVRGKIQFKEIEEGNKTMFKYYLF